MPSRNEVIGIVVTMVVVGAAFSLTGIMQGPSITGPNGEPIMDTFGQPAAAPDASPELMMEPSTDESIVIDEMEVVQ